MFCKKSWNFLFAFEKNKEFICVCKLFMNDSSQEIEKNEKLYYTFKNILRLVGGALRDPMTEEEEKWPWMISSIHWLMKET